MYRIAPAILVLIFLVGCTSHGAVEIRDETLRSALQPGTTTKVDVHNEFGQPHNVVHVAEDLTDWVYFSEKTRVHWGSMIPYLGYLTMGNRVDRFVLTIPFKEGIIADTPTTVDEAKYLNSWVALGKALQVDGSPDISVIRVEMESLSLPFDENAAKDGLIHLQFIGAEAK